ncbi:hypothetical protein C8R46DRAFT_1058561 [Mycena filopes]|nr:hypothetical protein C8R46DRAFT_1058561 [Mycena filopes]
MRLPLSFLFNPIFRVWNLRLLLSWTIFIIVYWAEWEIIGLQEQLAVAAFCLILLHHILGSGWQWHFKGSAIFDLGMTLFEVAGLCYIMYRVCQPHLKHKGAVEDARPLKGIFAVELVSLGISAIFRICTMLQTSKRLHHQTLSFLGECTPVYPPYTPLHIFLTRSTTRPLVRGESRLILFTRALVIWCIALGMPAFAVYSIIFQPLATKIYTQRLGPFDGGIQASPPGNATIIFTSNYLEEVPIVQVRALSSHGEHDCDTILPGREHEPRILQCPYPWDRLSGVSVSITIPLNTSLRFPFFITPIQGTFSAPDDVEYRSKAFILSVARTGVLLFPGSHLIGGFTWARRDIALDTLEWGVTSYGSSTRMRVYTPDVTGLQSDPTAETQTLDSGVATLTLVQLKTYPTSRFTDIAVSTSVAGIATLGGFWTFVNGAFTLIFGANVLYFAFGRRPLSALGIVHIFQRRRLQRQWHEDFPAIHTEGGLPGSALAGIVAFIRERLVDLGQSETPDDIEAQKLTGAPDTEKTSTPESTAQVKTSGFSRTREPGYILDEVPLLDADLGLADRFNTQNS